MAQIVNEIEQHLPYLRNYALALSHNPVAADDLVQECVTRALTKRHLFKAGTNLRAWLCTILHNLHINEVRHNGRWGRTVDPSDAEPILSSRPRQEDSLMVKSVRDALNRLAMEQRVAILLVVVDGLSYEEAAERLHLPVGTIKSRISRGREAIRAMVEGKIQRPRCKTGRPLAVSEAHRAQQAAHRLADIRRAAA